MIKRKGIFFFLFLIIAFLIFGLIFLVVLYKSSLFQEEARAMLPKSAKDIREFNWDNPGFVPDYWYSLKAKITNEEFAAYRNKMGFIPVPKDKWEELNNWSALSSIGSWWDPNEETKELYYNPNLKGSSKSIMKYEKGYLYYEETFGF